MVQKLIQIFLPFCHNPRVWRTDGQTDRRTDTFLATRPPCIQCSEVKSSRKFLFLPRCM